MKTTVEDYVIDEIDAEIAKLTMLRSGLLEWSRRTWGESREQKAESRKLTPPVQIASEKLRKRKAESGKRKRGPEAVAVAAEPAVEQDEAGAFAEVMRAERAGTQTTQAQDSPLMRTQLRTQHRTVKADVLRALSELPGDFSAADVRSRLFAWRGFVHGEGIEARRCSMAMSKALCELVRGGSVKAGQGKGRYVNVKPA